MGILISSYHCTHSKVIWSSTEVGFFLYLLTIVHTQGQFEVPRGWKFWYLLTIAHTQGQFEVPWGWEFWYLLNIAHTPRSSWSSMGVHFFHIFFRPLYTLKGEFEVPWGWEFWYLPTIVHSKVNVKFHGGGNFDVFLITIAPAQRSIWRSMRVEIVVSSYRCTNWRSIWSFMGVGILISSYHCTLKGQVEVPWGWEIWYLLTGVHTQCQFEVPWRWEFWYLLTIVRTQRFIWSSTGWDFWYLLTIVHIQGQFEIPWGWDLDIFLPLYTFKVNLKFMGFPKGRHAIIGRACGVAQSGDPRCTSGVAQYGKLRIYNRAGAESQLDIQCIRKGQGVQWMLNVMLHGLRWK